MAGAPQGNEKERGKGRSVCSVGQGSADVTEGYIEWKRICGFLQRGLGLKGGEVDERGHVYKERLRRGEEVWQREGVTAVQEDVEGYFSSV